MKDFAIVSAAGLALGAAVAGCAHVKVDPIQVQTIHIVHDVNIRVDKTLDDFFAFQEQQAAASTHPATTQATTQTAAAASPAATAGDVK